MSTTICIAANTIDYPKGGGHFWVYLNWALGFRSIGCNVIWLELIDSGKPMDGIRDHAAILKHKLSAYGFEHDLALADIKGRDIPAELHLYAMDIVMAAEISDLIINQFYDLPLHILGRFRRSALLDIDPGLLQNWMYHKVINVQKHDIYFTIGETVGRPGALFPDCGIKWEYTPPAVSLPHWPVKPAPANAPFTTLSHWNMDLYEEEDGEYYKNDKRAGFLPYLELPKKTGIPLELAIFLGENENPEREELQALGWRIKDSQIVASTPMRYQDYIQNSPGEFSCVKPSCVKLQNAWISDRTICYLASGKPAVIEHTGNSRFLPGNAGLLRFRNFDEALKCLDEVLLNYDKHSAMARALAEEYFDAKKVARGLLEKAL
ncbi:MAG: hypothetical protein WKF88_09915 [Ferruginibacter sp.]